MYCPCTYNSSWYHFVPITCMSVKGFSISYNVVNFFFKSRYFYMCIFSSKTIGWLPFLWRLSRFVSQFVFCLSVKYLKSVPIAGQCQKLFGPWLIWPKINRVLYLYLCIKFIVNLAQDFFYIDIHQTTPFLTQYFTLELQALRSLDLSPPLLIRLFLNSALHAATTVNQGQITQNCRRYTSGKMAKGEWSR